MALFSPVRGNADSIFPDSIFSKKKGKIFWGGLAQLPTIYRRPLLSGVHKPEIKDEASPTAFSLKSKFDIKKFSEEEGGRDVRSARRDIEIISKNLALEYFSIKNNE